MFWATAVAYAAEMGLPGGGGDGFSVGEYVVFPESGNGGASSPARAALTGHPLIIVALRRGLGAGIASGTFLGSDGILRKAFVPFRRPSRLGDTWRGGGFALAVDSADSW